MPYFRNLEHNVKRNFTSRLSILSLSPLVCVPSKPCKNQIVVKNIRIVAQWWTSTEGHLFRMYFSIFQPSVVSQTQCNLMFKVLSNRGESQVRVLPLNWEEVPEFFLESQLIFFLFGARSLPHPFLLYLILWSELTSSTTQTYCPTW